MPASLEERISYLEGWKESEQKLVYGLRNDINDVKERITHLEQQMNQRITLVETKIQNLEEKMNDRFVLIEAKIQNLEQKVDTHFRWLVGFQFTILLAIVSLLIRLVFTG